MNRNNRRLELIYLTFFSVLIIQPFLQKFEWSLDWFWLKNLDEAILFLAGSLVVGGIRLTRGSSMKLFHVFFLLYMLLGVVYSVWNAVPFVAVLVQTIFELKIFLVLFLLIAFSKSDSLQKITEQLIKLLVILNVPFVAFQFLSPEQYDEIFKAGGHKGLFILSDSTLTRAAGVFWHQNQLAFFSAIGAAYFLIVRRQSWMSLWVVLSILLLFASLQRQEIVSFVLALMLTRYWFVRESFKGKKVLFIIGSSVILVVLGFVFKPFIELFIDQSGLLQVSQSIDPRIVFYYNSFIVFFDNFPFGSGFGTFGGYAAANFNQSLYNELNFGNFSWYNQNIFLTDTYYPHVIAETGLLGVFCFVGFCRYLFLFIQRNSASENYKQFAFFSLTFLILVSFTSPNFNDIFCLFLTFTSFSFLVKSHRHNLNVKSQSTDHNASIG